ncbi:hypothetical protein GA0061105_11346 [Rhizobium aethiopicum]|uniref:Uncharacterized protein n=1 Tax=Rhizobium aethiopicum TaxID=1138170 RepID=A0A1C3Y8F3_9HYPH|nr:hypothetical protein GA0061105_11346 [Rhizobium aethiopicum]
MMPTLVFLGRRANQHARLRETSAKNTHNIDSEMDRPDCKMIPSNSDWVAG